MIQQFTEETVRSLYVAGSTQREIAVALSVSQRSVHALMKRAGIVARKAAKRDQVGARNHRWKNLGVSYLAAHKRVYRLRGKPQRCEKCEDTSRRMYHWANVSGRYDDPTDYVRLCVPCHRRFDDERKAA